MRIAITGISGYIGSLVLARLNALEEVEAIVGIDLKPPGGDSPKLKFYSQDISAPLGAIFAENEVDAALHLAFVMKPAHDKNGTRQVDIGGTESFLEGCRLARVGHILYLSSHTIYGAHPDSRHPLTEDAPPHPLPDFQYSWDKAEVERMLTDFAASHSGVCLTALRSCPVVGPHAHRSVARAMFTPIMLRVAGYDPPLQFVHEDDLARLIVELLRQRKPGIFNVAGDGEIRYSELAGLAGKRMLALPERLLRLLLDFSWALRLQSESPAIGLEFIKYPPLISTGKLQREAGFKFHYSSREAVGSFLSSLK
jgi:UDP-glucose 4-epimerase